MGVDGKQHSFNLISWSYFSDDVVAVVDDEERKNKL